MPSALAVSSTGRAQLALTQIAEVWRRDSRGAQYVEALKTFLMGLTSPNTRTQYSLSINEFFEWYESDTGRIPVPADVTREKAIRYAKWLSTRSVGLEEHRLKKDPTRRLDLEIYRAVKAEPGARIDRIRARLLTSAEFSTLAPYRPNAAPQAVERILKIEVDDAQGLDRHLGCLVQRRVLERSPTIDDIRSGRVTVPGVDADDPGRAQIDYRVPEDVFSYRVAAHSEDAGPTRASTTMIRLVALKSFWSFLIRSGENVEGMRDPLLKYNIWDAVTAQAIREAKSQQEVSRALKTPDIEVFNALLGTTYRQAADGTLFASRDLLDVRDRAILLFLLYVATRADELTLIRRADITWGAEPFVSMLGKGNKQRLVRIPDPAYQALLDLTAKLEEIASHAERRNVAELAAARALLAPEAPLFPPVSRWGCNSPFRRSKEYGEPYAGLSRIAVSKMLHRRAVLAGFDPGSPNYEKAHPHGFRHLAAKLAIDAGTPLPVIQSVLGHSSLQTTGIYTEVRDPRSRVLFGWSPPTVSAPAAAPPSAPQYIPSVAPSVSIPTPTRPMTTPPVAAPIRPVTTPPVAAPIHHPITVAKKPPSTVKRVLEAVGVSIDDIPGAPTAPPPAPAPAALVAPPRLTPPPAPPALPAPPSEERLVAVGAETPLLEPEERQAARELDPIYETGWGEPGRGEPLRRGAKPAGDDAFDTLFRTTAGRRSGLVWWSGPTGRLKPSMPVISPNQVVGEETAYGSVRDRLAEIWSAWMALGDADARGPTAAFALLAWIRDALEVTYDVESEVAKRDGAWVPYLAPIGETIDASTERRVFREHRDDKIAEWFYETAWQHRISRGRTATGGRPPRVVDTVLDVPTWYALEDPLSELSDAERTDLFDWLRVLTGRPPVDATPRYSGVSRKAIGELIGLFCTYDANRSELRRAQQAGEKAAVRDLKETLEDDRQAVNLVAQKLTRGKPFDIKQAVDARVATTRQIRETEAIRKARGEDEEDDGSPREKREGNRKFYLGIVGQLFGEAAEADDILQLFAYCNQEDAPLSSGRYPELFHMQGKTIVHDAAFAREFAKETGGAHSECVARRMARELWELRKAQIAAELAGKPTPRLIQRSDELLEWLGAMAFFKIPCPRAMERELADRIADKSPLPVYEEWQRWRAEIERTFSKERSALREARAKEAERRQAVLEEFTEPAAAYREAAMGEVLGKPMEPNARAREYRYTPNMRRLVPSPVLLLFCTYAR